MTLLKKLKTRSGKRWLTALVAALAPVIGAVLLLTLSGPTLPAAAAGLVLMAFSLGNWTMTLLAGAAKAAHEDRGPDVEFGEARKERVVGHECGWTTIVRGGDDDIQAAIWHHMMLECPLREEASP